MAYSYEEWKKRDAKRRKPNISSQSYSDFEKQYHRDNPPIEEPKRVPWKTMSEIKRERARQADADRFAGRYMSEEADRVERGRTADAQRFAGRYSDEHANPEKYEPSTPKEVSRQADADRFAGRYTAEAANPEKYKQPEPVTPKKPLADFNRRSGSQSQFTSHVEIPDVDSKKEDKPSLLSRVFENAKTQLDKPGFHERNLDRNHKVESELFQGFTDKDSVNDTLTKRAGANLRLGTGDAVESVAGAIRWLAPKLPFTGDVRNLPADLLQKGADKMREGFEDDAFGREFELEDWNNPEWLATQGARALPQLLTSWIPGLGIAGATGKIAKLQKLPKLYRTLIPPVAGGGGQAAIDATLEAGGVYDEALRRGMTEEEANSAANEAFKHNFALNSGMDIAQFILMLSPLKKLDNLGKLPSVGLRTAGGALTEGFQEVAQTGITANALGDEFNWTDPSSVEAGLLGAILGGGVTGGVSGYKAVKDSLSKNPAMDSPVTEIIESSLDGLPADLRLEFDQAVAEMEEGGMPRDEALEAVSEQLLNREPAFAEVMTETMQDYIEDKKLEQQNAALNPVAQQEEMAKVKQLRSKKKRQQKKWLKNNMPQTPEVGLPGVLNMPSPPPGFNASLDVPSVPLALPSIVEPPIAPPSVEMPVQAPEQAQMLALPEPIDIQVGDSVNLQGTKPETQYLVEAVEQDHVQVLTPNKTSIKVPKARVVSKLDRMELEETPYESGESSTLYEDELPQGETLGNVELPPNFRSDLREGLRELVSEGASIEQAVADLKADDYYSDSPEWHNLIDEEAKALGYKPQAQPVEAKQDVPKKSDRKDYGSRFEIGDTIYQANTSGVLNKGKIKDKDERRYEVEIFLPHVNKNHIFYSPMNLPEADQRLYTDKQEAENAAKALKQIEDKKREDYTTGKKPESKPPEEKKAPEEDIHELSKNLARDYQKKITQAAAAAGVKVKTSVDFLAKLDEEVTVDLLRSHNIEHHKNSYVAGKARIRKNKQLLDIEISLLANDSEPVTQEVIHEFAEVWLELWKQADKGKYWSAVGFLQNKGVNSARAEEMLAEILTDYAISSELPDILSEENVHKKFFGKIANQFKSWVQQTLKRISFYRTQVWDQLPPEIQEQARLFVDGEWEDAFASVKDKEFRVQDRFSVKQKAIQPSSDLWKRGPSANEIIKMYPNLFEVVPNDETSKGHPTQITGTDKTYGHFFDFLGAEGFKGTVLDASSGKGLGTQLGRKRGFKVDDYEPFPEPGYSPKFTSYKDIKKQYDVVISSSVLNVIPQDFRDSVVSEIGRSLKDGGRAFITVRGKDVLNSSSKKSVNNFNAEHDENMEYYIEKKQSYQKGFNKKELVAYLEDVLAELPGNFEVAVMNEKNIGYNRGVGAVVTRLDGARFSVKELGRDPILADYERFFGKKQEPKEEKAASTLKEGDRVAYTDRSNNNFTGSIRSIDERFGSAMVVIDQIATPGRVPIGRLENVPLSWLKKESEVEAKQEEKPKEELAPKIPELYKKGDFLEKDGVAGTFTGEYQRSRNVKGDKRSLSLEVKTQFNGVQWWDSAAIKQLDKLPEPKKPEPREENVAIPLKKFNEDKPFPKVTYKELPSKINVKFVPNGREKQLTLSFNKKYQRKDRDGKNLYGNLLLPENTTIEEINSMLNIEFWDGMSPKRLIATFEHMNSTQVKTPKKPDIVDDIENGYIYINDYKLEHPSKVKMETLEQIYNGLSFEESGMEDKKTFNKYASLLTKELEKRWKAEEAAEEKPAPPKKPDKLETKTFDVSDLNKYESKEEAKKPESPKEEPTKYDKMHDRLEFTKKAAEAARKRLAERHKGTTTLHSGLPMDDLIDYSIIGMDILTHKMIDIAELTEIMVKDFGEGVRDWMPSIYAQSRAFVDYEEPRIEKMLRDAYKDENITLFDEGKESVTDEVETDSDKSLEASEPGEVPGTKTNGNTGTGSTGGKRGNGGRDTSNVPGNGSKGTTTEQQSTGHDSSPEHDLETSGGSESSPDIRKPRRVKSNFKITNELDSFGSVNERFLNNVKAIKLVKQLEDEGRFASPEEQSILARYVGWGGLSNAFNTTNDKWKKQYDQIKEFVEDGTISEQEYDEAKRTTQYAHYTSKTIINSMYQAVEAMGVKGGRVLEPGMGIGNFFGLMPEGWKADLTGVEYDGITGRIAKQLYQKANVEVKAYQDFTMADNYFDLAIGNPPFSGTTFDYNGDSLTLHNYFFVKSLDKIRPGGILAFVTSSGTMNSKGTQARQLMSDKADFLGAIRLPGDAFKDNAGTEVTTDIVFFQKREQGAKPNHRGEFLNSNERAVIGRDGKPAKVQENEYFRDNPDMVLGNLTTDKLINTKAKPRLAVVSDGRDFNEILAEAIETLPKNIYEETTVKVDEIKHAESIKTSLTNLVEGNFGFEDGKLIQISEGRAILRPDITGAKIDRIKGLVKIRDAAKEALQLQRESADDKKVALSLKKLNFVYDNYVKNFKTINSTSTQRPNITAMKDDPVGLSILMSLEKEEKGAYVKQDIFKERVISFVPDIKNVSTSEEALVVSLSQKARIDLPYMTEISGISEEKILADLGTKIYLNPGVGWETEDEYLSGNVRIKLELAEKAAQDDKKFERNVNVLKAIIPDDIPSDYIKVQFGTPWIPDQDYTDFVNSFFQARNQRAKIRFIPQTGDWRVEGGIETAVNHSEHGVRSTLFRGDRLTGLEIIELALNSKQPLLKYGHPKDRHVDQDATNLARLKLEELEGEFQDWLFSNKDREQRLVRKYNDEFNSVVLREYNGELVYGGETEATSKPFAGGFNNAKYILRKHQKSVVWRMVQGGNTLLAHVVGAGKTLEMIVAGMEMKRLGMVRKPTYIVPNNLFEQWEKEFREAYPDANILMLSGDLVPPVGIQKRDSAPIKIPASFNLGIDLDWQNEKVSIKGSKKKYKLHSIDGQDIVLIGSDKKKINVKRNQVETRSTQESDAMYKARLNDQRALRGAALNKIAVGNYDAVIMTHDTFKKLPMSPEYSREYIREQLNNLEFALISLKEEGDSSRSVKQLEKAKEAYEKQLKELMDADGKDIAIPFENLGIDQLFVDEAHKFKNLKFFTKLNGITGLSNTASQRSEDLYMKTKWLTKVRNGKGIVFATGTPISNTMAEMFTMQRYLQYNRLEELNIKHFDMWSKMFADTETGTEMDVAGGFKERTRFKTFKNLPELMTVFKETTDIKTAKMLNLETPKNVEMKTIVAPLSEQQKAYMNNIVSRANDVQSGYVDKEDDNWLKITGDARKMSLDIRLAEPTADEDKESKVNLAVENIFEIWKAGKKTRPDKKGKPLNNTTQLVFADMGTPKAAKQNAEGDEIENDEDEVLSFDVYSDMRNKLIKLGIPKEELAFIHEAKTPKKKEKLFKDMKSGKVRVLFGSTEKMGAGMNVQDRLEALHHIDAPWRPSDIEQREGRMIRQGNKLDDVTVYSYVTEGSFDPLMWELLKNKAAFVEQLMNGDGSIREMEDVGPMEFRFGHISAAAYNDRTILDKNDVDNLVKKLRSGKEGHRQKQRQNKRDVSELPERIARLEKLVANGEKDLKNRPILEGTNFKIELDGKVYDKRTEAAEALDKIFTEKRGLVFLDNSVLIGKVGTFDLSLVLKQNWVSFEVNMENYYYAQYNELSAAGSLTRLENTLEKMNENVEREKDHLENLKDELQNKLKNLDAPFKQEAQLEAALKKQHELNQKMLAMNKGKERVVDVDENGNHEDTFFESKTSGFHDAKYGKLDDGTFQEYAQAPKETLDKTVTRPQIMKYIKDHFKVKIDYGHVRGKGVYKNKFAIIRTKNYGDFEVLAHELGHRIDKKLRLSLNPALQKELAEFAEANLILPKSLGEFDKAKEGVAEYFRQVFYGNHNFDAMPEEERAKVIPFHAVSKRLQKAINDGLSDYQWEDRVTELRHLFQSWLGRDPKQEWAGITTPFGEKFKENIPLKRQLNQFYSGFLEENYAIKAAQDLIEADKKYKAMDDKDAYGLTVATRGSTARAVGWTEYSTFTTDFVRTNGAYVETGESLKDIIEDVLKIGDVDEFGQFLVARHLYNLKTEKGKWKSPITISDETKLALEQAEETYGALADRFYDFRHRMLEDILVTGNLVSQELAEKFKEEYKYYVPLARRKTETGYKGGIQTGGAGGGIVNSQQGIKRMSKFGSSDMVINPLETTLNELHLFMALADKNAAGLALASWADPDSEFASEIAGEIIERVDFPTNVKEIALKALEQTLFDAGLSEEIMEEMNMDKVHLIYEKIFKPNGNNNEVLVWSDGKPINHKIHDSYVFDAVVGSQNRFLTAVLTNPFAKILTIPASLLMYGITASPIFTVSIFIRSYMQLMYKSRGTKLNLARLPVQFMKSLNDARTKNIHYREWLASGAGQSTFVSSQTKFTEKFKQEIRYKAKAAKMMKLQYKPADFSEALGILTYMTKNYGVAAGMNKLQEFNDLLDSSLKMAEYETIKRQTGNKLQAVLASRESDMDHKRQGNDFMKIWNKVDPFNRVAFQGMDAFARTIIDNPIRHAFRGLLFFGLPSILLALSNYDDEEYWELTTQERDMNWIWKVNGQFYKLKIPFEAGVVFKTIIEKIAFEAMDHASGQNKETWKDFGKNVRQTMIPAMVPMFINLVVNYTIEKDWATGREFVPSHMKSDKDKLQYNESTSEVAKWLGGVVDKSPMVLDATIKNLTGTLGTFALHLTDKGLDKAGIVDRPDTKGLVYGYMEKQYKVSIDDGTTDSVNDFYKKKSEIEEEHQDTGVSGRPSAQNRQYDRAEKDMAALRKVRDGMLFDRLPTKGGSPFPKEEKKRRIDIANKGIRDIARFVAGKDPIDPENLEEALKLIQGYKQYEKAMTKYEQKKYDEEQAKLKNKK